ncbi:MAG: outer membrane beta-barrel family protein, partial [Bacteroidota bacterium]
SDGSWDERFYLYREQFGTTFDQSNNHTGNHQSHNFKLGTDFFLNEKNTVGFLVNGYTSDHVWKSNSQTAISEVGSSIVDSTLIASGDMDGMRQNYNFNVNYRFDDAKGTIWNIDADYGIFKNEDDQNQPNEYRTGDGGAGSSLLRYKEYQTVAPTSIDIGTFKLDHERPLAKGTLSAGAKFSYVKTDNDFNFFNVLEGKPEVDIERTNFFEYTENVNAVYANFSRKLGEKFSFQAGLRAEQTNSEGNLTDLTGIENDSNHVKRDYFDLFPSGGLTWNANPINTLSLTYSRRLDRPSYQDLNPFEGRLDELTFEKGNPFLNPQYSHNIQLNHTY